MVSRPSAVTTPVGVIRSIGLVSRVTSGLGERGVVVVGERRPLAAEGVVRGQLLPQLRVGDLLAQVSSRGERGAPVEEAHPSVAQDGEDHQRLEQRGVDPPGQALGDRQPGEEAAYGPGDLEVELGGHEDRGALEDRQVGGTLRELRHQLDRRGPGADHCDPLAVEVGSVVPLGGVYDGPGELLDAQDVGDPRLGQEAGRGDEVRRPDRLAAGHRDLPHLVCLVPPRAVDNGVEAHVPAQVVLVGDVGGVLLQLGATGVPVPPPRVRLEGVGVGHAGDVDGQAGVAVDVPGPAEVVLALEDDEVVDAESLELDGRTHPAEAGADDHCLVSHAY